MQSQPDLQKDIVESGDVYHHVAANVSVGPPHLVGRAFDAPQRHGCEERFHHQAADILPDVPNSIAHVLSIFALDADDPGLPKRGWPCNVPVHRSAAWTH